MSDSSVVISSCPSSPVEDENEHLVDYLILIDFEATCDTGPTPKITRSNQEMVEFPFVLVKIMHPSEFDVNDPDAVYARIVHHEQHYVMPEYTSQLTPFCTQLTGITDEILRTKGQPLRKVINHFDEFVSKNLHNKRFCILTDGEWDLRQLLMRESMNKQIPLLPHYYTFFDLRKEYKKCFPNAHVRGLSSMVAHSGTKFVGRHHSGIDDCMTIVQLVEVLLRNGHKFLEPCVIDECYDPFRDTSFCEFHQSPPKAVQYTPVHHHPPVPMYYAPYNPYFYLPVDVQQYYGHLYSSAYPTVQQQTRPQQPRQGKRSTKGKSDNKKGRPHPRRMEIAASRSERQQ